MIEAKTLTELFEGHPERWTQRCDARKADDTATTYDCPEATQFCLLGGAFKVYYKHGTSNKVHSNLIKSVPPGFKTVSGFNDDPGTTFQDILEVAGEYDRRMSSDS